MLINFLRQRANVLRLSQKDNLIVVLGLQFHTKGGCHDLSEYIFRSALYCRVKAAPV
jgi:hypothetical protein